MIFLNNTQHSVFNINKDLLTDYKVQGDRRLVSIKRNLSKQLVYYILYTELQKVNNYYFNIIDKLMCDKYTDISQLKKDYASFNQVCKSFLKSCEGFITDDVILSVQNDVNKLTLLIDKLIYILENICYDSTEDLDTDEIHTIL